LITSLTTLLAVISIYIFSTGVIKDFAFNLIVGVVVGTYSSIFIASPILLGWQNIMEKRKKAKQEGFAGKKKTQAKSQKETSVKEGEEEQNIQNVQVQGGKTDQSIKQEKGGRKKPRKKKKKKKKK
jgi:preprotein translocase subunit SecF